MAVKLKKGRSAAAKKAADEGSPGTVILNGLRKLLNGLIDIILSLKHKFALLLADPAVFIEKAKGKFRGNFWFKDDSTIKFMAHNKKVWSDWRSDAQHSVILFDYYKIAETEIARSYLLNVLSKKHNAKINNIDNWYMTWSLNDVL